MRLGKYEDWVQERVDSGDYASAAEVIRAGLRLLKEEEEWRTEVRRKIAEGIEDVRLGRTRDVIDVIRDLRRDLEEPDGA